ncbi:MAG: type pilus assembly protein PilQ [Verrucomicrobiota bacterium]
MANRLKPILFGTAALLGSLSLSPAQISPSPGPSASPTATPYINNTNRTAGTPAPVVPVGTTTSSNSTMTIVQASAAAATPAGTATVKGASTEAAPEADASAETGGVGVREFQGDDVGQVLRLLARQAKINMVVSEAVTGTVTMRLEDVTALQAVAIIVKAKGLFMDKIDNVYYVKTGAERTSEPTESDSYQFSYGRAKDSAALVASQLASKEPPQVDERTNTVFFRETRSNIDNVRKLFTQIDKPTKQVMIEARLVEVTANPRQSYGINWAGVVGGSTTPQTFKYGASNPRTIDASGKTTPPTIAFDPAAGTLQPRDWFLNALPGGGLNALAGQFAILSVPQMSATLRLLNEDSDAEFLANPRIVTADNQQAKIEIIRNQPVPQLNFNAQTATAVFGGFEDKKFGNTLVVRPSVNKDNFVTLAVRPEISNKVGDQAFFPPGSANPVLSPIIDTRSLDSNVLIKSGDTLAIGGLMQDEVTKGRTKVPIMGDIPVLGYLFQEKLNTRTKRNLLVFVTPTIIDQHYGTGLEDQVSGLHHSGEEYADPNGWRNNAKGAVRLVPTSNRQVAAEYPKPGIAPAPAEDAKVQFMSSAKDRDF